MQFLSSKLVLPSRVLVALFMLLLGLAGPSRAGDFEADSFSEIGDIQRRVAASHFLTRATFGPNAAEIDALAERIGQIGRYKAFEEWINTQLYTLPISSNPNTYEADRGRLWPLAKKMLADMGYRSQNLGNQTGDGGVYDYQAYKEHAWWHRAITAEDQLRQRMAWALSQIFVAAEGPAVYTNNQGLDTSGNPRWLGLARYYDEVCITNAFGSYRDLLDSMTYHPVMGVWLTTVQNRKANPATGVEPDENYAREIMQLFSIGLVELNADGTHRLGPDGQAIETYDNETITALARVFTGLVYDNNNNNSDSFGAGSSFQNQMEMYQQEHDTNLKVAFDGRLVIPARSQSDANARRDISDVHDFLAFNHPNTAPFICRRLIQRFVMSNPSRGYIRRVARVFNKNKNNPNQLGEVVKAILLDRAALDSLKYERLRSPPGLSVVRRYETEGTRLREPVMRYVAMIRAFTPYPAPEFLTNQSKVVYTTPGGPEGDAGNQYFFIDNDSNDVAVSFAQAPFENGTVFNYYVPDYQPPGDVANYLPSASIPNRRLYAPEFQILTPVTANGMMNEFRSATNDSDFGVGSIRTVNGSSVALEVNFDFDRFFEHSGMLGPVGTEPSIARVRDFIEELDILLCAGTMSNTTRQVLIDVCQAELDQYTIDTEGEKEDLVQAVIGAVLQSPDCAVLP